MRSLYDIGYLSRAFLLNLFDERAAKLIVNFQRRHLPKLRRVVDAQLIGAKAAGFFAEIEFDGIPRAISLER